jgi:shikimate kinase
LNESESLASLLDIIQSHPAGRVVLIGPQGAGKTTLGKQAAAVLGWPCFDSDALLLTRFHAQYGSGAADNVAAVYRALGWWRFRYWENQVVKQLHKAPSPCIISLGGGAHLYAPACKPLYRHAMVIGIDRVVVSTWGARLRAHYMKRHAAYLLRSVSGAVPVEGDGV